MKVCHAIQHAHQKGIIHRDIKPSNILVTLHDGVPVPKVIDFGIAKATEGRLTDSTIYTQLHQFLGTPAYMSPEQAEMSGLDIDTRSDIYCLGVVLYELLAGSTPFNPRELLAAGLDAMRKTLREAEPPRPSTRLATLPGKDLTTTARRRAVEAPRLIRMLQGDLDWIVMKCLEKDRTRRYESASGLAADLKRHLDNEPVIARAATAAYRLQKMFRRHKAAFTGAAALIALLLTGLWAATAAWQREKVLRTRSETAEHNQALARAEAEKSSRLAREAEHAANIQRDRAAILLSLSQAETGVRLLEQNDPVGLLHLIESRKSVDHLAEEKMRRTLLWSGWIKSMPSLQTRITPLPARVGDWPHLTGINLDPAARSPWRAIGTTNGEVVLWDENTGRQITAFHVKPGAVFVSGMSHNGRLMIVNASGRFQLWDCAPIRSNLPPRRLLGKILRHAFDPAGRRVVTYSNQGIQDQGEAPVGLPAPESKVQIWDSTSPGALMAAWEGNRDDLSNHNFALTADGSKVITGWESLKQWDAQSGREITPPMRAGLSGKGRQLTELLFVSADGKWLWEARRDTCQRYDLATGEAVGQAITNLHRWNPPTVSPGREHLLVPLQTGFMVVRFANGERTGPAIPRDDNAMRPLALSADGALLATTDSEQALRVWNTESGQQIGRTVVMPVRVASASFSLDGNSLSWVGEDRQLRVHSLAPEASSWVKRWEGVKIIGFNRQGDALTYQVNDRTLGWRRPADAQPTAAWTVPDQGALIGSAVRVDGSVAATAFQTGKDNHSVIRLWDTRQGAQIGPAITWTNLGALAFSPDGATLAGLGGADGSGSIQLWDTATGQPKSILHAEPSQTSWLTLRFSPDGRFAAARNSYVTIVWDLAGGAPVGGRDQFYTAISDDWRWAIGKDLLDFSDPRQPKAAAEPLPFAPNRMPREGLALSSNGELRLSAGAPKSMRIWNNITGRAVGKEIRVANPVRQAVFSPDARLVLTYESSFGSTKPNEPSTVRLWETSSGLPCGPAVPIEFIPTEFLFDPHSRFLAIPAPFETTTSIMISLPDRDAPITEMQQQSALLAASRLDESGAVIPSTSSELDQPTPTAGGHPGVSK
ncbi:MAG TPA: WD40 repeat domain-containing serine/threonine-protein kinase [Methylomirabilota bacterium]|nr:WD40 repeat domain-containing serine/threonine-protein kinase [Methylomirabilota bacterium]